MKIQVRTSVRWAYLWLVVFGLLNLLTAIQGIRLAATWLAPLFAMRFLYTYPKRRKWPFFFLVYWISLAITTTGSTPDFVPGPVDHYIFMLFMGVLPGIIPFAMDRWLAPRLRRDGYLPFLATLIYPLAVTTIEYLGSSSNPIGNFGALGYSQYDFSALIQIASVTGMMGLTFLVSWFASIANWAWENSFAWPRLRTGIVTYAALVAVVVGFGVVRLATAPGIESVETVPVVSFTVAENHVGPLNKLLSEDREAFRRETQAVHAEYLAMTERAVADGAKIVLWPEIAIVGLEQDVQALVAQGQALARREGIYLAMPTFTLFPDEERPAENVMFVADPSGKVAIEHVKYGGNIIERTLEGSREIQVIDTPYGRLSGIICWDTNYPGIVRQVGELGADILLSPSKEWEGINPLHAEMAVFRAIENGVAVVRQADEGLSIVVDAYGRTLSTGEGLAATGNYVRADVPTAGTTTLYSVVGDLVGLVSVVGLVAVVAYALIAGWRRQKSKVQSPATVTS